MSVLLNYPPETVIVIVCAFIAAIFGFLKAYSWLEVFFENLGKKHHIRTSIPKRVKKLEEENAQQTENINLLIEAQRSAIKAELVKQCQYFEKQGYIDWHSRDVIYQQFDIYKRMNGNSWLKDIVERIKKIPSEEEYFKNINENKKEDR